MRWKEIERILDRDTEWSGILEEYDRTGVMPTRRVRCDFTLSAQSMARLKEESKRTGKKPSRILDEIIMGRLSCH